MPLQRSQERSHQLMDVVDGCLPSTPTPPSGRKDVVETASPLAASFKKKLRPCLDLVDKLRSLGVSEAGIRLPTIVVVGDQSSGKSSVLESLSGVELPKGSGIVTRAPLLLRLKGSASGDGDRPRMTLSYFGKESFDISETDISEAITKATDEIAGPGKAIVDKPITLTVCRHGAPDLTLVDLPGITRVPILGQPDDICDKIKDLILRYITPKETIILNVLNATIDFSVCESIRMSRQVDKHGSRTLGVVTKVDMSPSGLLQKITDDNVKIGLGYICVRNRTTKEASFEEAKVAEEKLFSSHEELCKISKCMVGVPALANRLVQLQTQAIADLLPSVLKQIDTALDVKREELKRLCGDICNVADANVAFFNVFCSVRRALQDILICGQSHNSDILANDYDYGTNHNATLHVEFAKFAEKITGEYGCKAVRRENGGGYLGFIQRLFAESLGTNLPNVVSQSIMEKVLGKMLDSLLAPCASELPAFVHDASRDVVLFVVARHASRFPNLKKIYVSAFQRALTDCKNVCFDTVNRLIEMEKAIIYTTSEELYNVLLKSLTVTTAGVGKPGSTHAVHVVGLKAPLDLSDLANISDERVRNAACSIVAYWILLSRRLADQICHELRFSFNKAMLEVVDKVTIKVMQPSFDMEEVMAEQPEVALERSRLRSTVDLLSTSKEFVFQFLGDTMRPAGIVPAIEQL